MSQKHKWVRSENNTSTFRADSSFRGLRRFDCVRLKNAISTNRSKSIEFIQLVAFISGVTEDNKVIAVGIPMRKIIAFEPNTVAQEELAQEMEIVEYCEEKVVAITCDCLQRIEQIQYIENRSQSRAVGLINNFYYSNIFCSSSVAPMDEDE
jgi:hypothetical protein